MLLHNVSLPGEDGLKNIAVEDGIIRGVLAPSQASPPQDSADGLHLYFDESAADPSRNRTLAFPGLINSHDHLDFNLFPALGNRTYENYTAWGWDIHAKNTAAIDAVLKIPQQLRTQWGIYKNLLNGFTTVVNHGQWLETGEDELITVFQDCHCLHSVRFERNWRWKLLRRLNSRQSVVVHIGEGTDKAASREIDRLTLWNFFHRSLIGIHGVAMDERQAAGFSALVWCPASNYFLLDRTAPVHRLKNKLPILFGTDSTLTAGWNSWEQFRLAREEGMLSDRELLDSLTKTPAAIWGLPAHGEIAPGRQADLVLARAGYGISSLDAFYSINPEDLLLVMHKGKISLFDSTVYDQVRAAGLANGIFSRTTVNGTCKYVKGDLPGLLNNIRSYHPGVQLPVSTD